MSFDKISFSHWFIETKDIIEQRFLPFINPETQEFFKCGSIYLALTFNAQHVYLNMLIGKEKDNSEGLREFISACKRAGIKIIRFGTYAKNTKMIRMFKYIKATEINRIDNFYIDGDALIEYELNIEETKRFGQ